MTGIFDQALDLAGGWSEAWLHELRGPHGEWVKSGAELEAHTEAVRTGVRAKHGPYQMPPHDRLINPRSRQYPDPADHPFFKKYPVSHVNIEHAWDLASPGQVQQGMRWYPDSGLLAKGIAHGDTHIGAGLLSAYSPQTSWPVNMFNAARSIELGRAIGPGEGTTVMGSHQNNAQKILDGKSYDEAFNPQSAPKTNSFAKLIGNGGEDAPEDPYGDIVVDRHAVSVAAGQRISDTESPPIGDKRFYDVIGDEYRQAAINLSNRYGFTISPSQVQAVTWLVQQTANEAEDAELAKQGKLSPQQARLAKGRVTRTKNAWASWMKYAGANNLPVATGTTALSMMYEPEFPSVDNFALITDLAFNPLEPRDSHGRWTRIPGVSEAKDSLEKHTVNGAFTPERAALHKRIIESIVGGHAPQQHPVATFFGGGSASGKSALKAITPDNAKIDADEIKAQLPEYQQMTAAGDTHAAAFTHEESSAIAKMAQREAERRRINYILDGTGDNSFDKMASKVSGARSAGYGINAHYVTVDTDEAVRRAAKRAERTGRMVPETVIRGIHAGVSGVFRQAAEQHLFDRAELYDNNGEGAAKLIAEHGPGQDLQVHDPQAYQRFLDKEKEDVTRKTGGTDTQGAASGGGLPASGGAGQSGGQGGVGLSSSRPGEHAARSSAGRPGGLHRGATLSGQFELAGSVTEQAGL